VASEARNDTLDASSGHDTSKVLGGTAGNIPQRQTSKLCDSLGRAMQFYCLDKMTEAIGLYDGASAFVIASREVADKRNCLLNDWLAVGVHHHCTEHDTDGTLFDDCLADEGHVPRVLIGRTVQSGILRGPWP
jgi:hypothetical protein